MRNFNWYLLISPLFLVFAGCGGGGTTDQQGLCPQGMQNDVTNFMTKLSSIQSTDLTDPTKTGDFVAACSTFDKKYRSHVDCKDSDGNVPMPRAEFTQIDVMCNAARQLVPGH